MLYFVIVLYTLLNTCSCWSNCYIIIFKFLAGGGNPNGPQPPPLPYLCIKCWYAWLDVRCFVWMWEHYVCNFIGWNDICAWKSLTNWHKLNGQMLPSYTYECELKTKGMSVWWISIKNRVHHTLGWWGNYSWDSKIFITNEYHFPKPTSQRHSGAV